MSDLAKVQEWMAALLRHERALPLDATVREDASRHVAGNDRLTPAEQLEIYREQFWLRHTASLVEDFPGLSGILGQEDWERLVEGYLGEVAPTSWSLRDLGDRLPAYVERCDWLEHHELAVDMAQLEWRYIEIFDAKDAARLEAARVAAIPPESWRNARMRFAPAVRFLDVRYPVVELRRKLRMANKNPVPIPARQPAHLVLHRGSDRNLRYTEVSAVESALLRSLYQGEPLLAACEAIAERFPDDTAVIQTSVGRWFHEWARREWIVDVESS